MAAQRFPCTCWSLWRPTKGWMPLRRWWYGSGRWWRNCRTMRGPCSSGLCGAGPGYPGQSPTSGGETLYSRYVLFIELSLIIFFFLFNPKSKHFYTLMKRIWKQNFRKAKFVLMYLCWPKVRICFYSLLRKKKRKRSRSSLCVSKEFIHFFNL